MLNVVLLFLAAILYDVAVGGAIEVLGSFVTKDPLSWGAIQVTRLSVLSDSIMFLLLLTFPFCLLPQVGYGNAAGNAIFLTSFLGVKLFRRCAIDATLILIGMLSFASGIYFMSFVTATYMFYLGEAD